MSDQLEQRIQALEELAAQQDYTIESLNNVVTSQSEKLQMFEIQLEAVRQQLDSIKSQWPDHLPAIEIPPHY